MIASKSKQLCLCWVKKQLRFVPSAEKPYQLCIAFKQPLSGFLSPRAFFQPPWGGSHPLHPRT